MSELMLINPRRKKRARKMSAKQRAYFGGGRRKRRASVSGTANPRRRRSSRRRVRVSGRRNPTAVKVRRLRRSGRRSGGSLLAGLTNPGALIKNTIIPSAIGGAGALAVDIAWGFAPIPANIKSGPLGPVVKLVGAIVLGGLVGKFAGRAVGEKVASGYITVFAYNMAKNAVQKAMPQLALGGYDMGYVSAGMQMPDANGVSAYLTSDVPSNSAPGMGAYMNEYDNNGYGATY